MRTRRKSPPRQGRPPVSLASRLAAKIDRSGGPEACHPWTAHTDKDGYGRISLGSEIDRTARTRHAHRLVLEAELGRPLGPGMCALHSCDNPPCCNPAHLWEGTHKQNAEDREAKGRSRDQRGEKNLVAKLTAADVRALRAKHAAGASIGAAARALGITRSTAHDILREKTWTHIS